MHPFVPNAMEDVHSILYWQSRLDDAEELSRVALDGVDRFFFFLFGSLGGGDGPPASLAIMCKEKS